METAAAPRSGTPSVYRIQEPTSGLYIRFTCQPAPRDEAPRIVAKLTRRDRATRFTRHAAAAECFARYLAGSALEIVRCDA
jgi:hypothetical protein